MILDFDSTVEAEDVRNVQKQVAEWWINVKASQAMKEKYILLLIYHFCMPYSNE